MEFADGQCYLCGKELGKRKPKDVVKVDKPFDVPSGRLVDFASPCPFCGGIIPVWEPVPEPSAPAPVAPTEPEPSAPAPGEGPGAEPEE